MNAYANPMISTYLHLETDAEFMARIQFEVPKLHPDVRGCTGELLDNIVWAKHKVQRKLVWVTP